MAKFEVTYTVQAEIEADTYAEFLNRESEVFNAIHIKGKRWVADSNFKAVAATAQRTLPDNAVVQHHYPERGFEGGDRVHVSYAIGLSPCIYDGTFVRWNSAVTAVIRCDNGALDYVTASAIVKLKG